MTREVLPLLGALVEDARRAGADAADAVAIDSTSLSVAWRLGGLENLERSESRAIGLRVFAGRRQAVVSSTDPAEGTLAEVVRRAVAMARAAPEDPHCGLAEPDQLAGDAPELDVVDPDEPAAEALVADARAAEDAARAVAGITNSEGAETGWSRAVVAVAGNDIIPRARGAAERLVQEGTAYKEEVVARAQGEAARFLSVYSEYAQNMDVVRRRMYLETMEEVLGGIDKIIIDSAAQGGSGVVPYLPLPELQRRQGTGDTQ